LSSQQVHYVVLTLDPTIRQALAGLFPRDGWRLDQTDDPSGVVEALTETTSGVLVDEATEPAYLSLAKRIRKTAPAVDVTVVGGPKSDAVKREERLEGVDFYVERPLEARALRASLEHRFASIALKTRAGIVGRSPSIEELLESILLVAPTEVPILIQGESGTGKDVVAHAIHDASRRSDKPFEAINCGSLAEGVLESELFGHEKGAFTGAVARRAGMFERAHTGTIFLDEVGETSPNMQVRLLRVLETGEVLRVGGGAPIKVDVRVVAATNKSLADAVRSGAFRQDLYYRLKGVSLYLPPLRERKEDIPILVQRFMAQANRAHQKSVRGVEPDAMRRFVEHSWPGNIRELKNVVETLVVLSPGPRISRALVDAHLVDASPAAGSPLLPVALGRSREEAEREMLYASLLALHRDVREILRVLKEGGVRSAAEADAFEGLREVHPDQPARTPPSLSLDHIERTAIREALNRSGGNRRRAADALGISERTLYRKIKEYGLG
jgi:DNA-binding NtrC family response regulator